MAALESIAPSASLALSIHATLSFSFDGLSISYIEVHEPQ